MTRDAPFPECLTRFVELFNRGDFWDSHEVLEGPWRESKSGFYHGLILFASAFVHVRRDNAHGIEAQLEKAEGALAPFAPGYLGIDVERLLGIARALGERVRSPGPGPTGGMERGGWSERIEFPRITLDLERVRGDEEELGSEWR